MKTEAAPRNTKRPGDKLGELNGDPRALCYEAMMDRETTRRIVERMHGPASSPTYVREDDPPKSAAR